MKQLCPVCNGVGKVEPGFYSFGNIGSNLDTEICRTCKGEGVIES